MTFTCSIARAAENSVARFDAGTTDEGIRELRAITNKNRMKTKVSKTSATPDRPGCRHLHPPRGTHPGESRSTLAQCRLFRMISENCVILSRR